MYLVPQERYQLGNETAQNLPFMHGTRSSKNSISIKIATRKRIATHDKNSYLHKRIAVLYTPKTIAT